VSAARFIGGLLPFGSEKKEHKAAEKAAAAAAAQQTAPVAPSPDQVVGTVRFAYDNFVLIYTPIKLNLPAGTRVSTIGKDGLIHDVELSMSSERKGTFLVADVISGQPVAGELVVLKPGSKAATVAQYQVLE
jgi:plastocyanin